MADHPERDLTSESSLYGAKSGSASWPLSLDSIVQTSMFSAVIKMSTTARRTGGEDPLRTGVAPAGMDPDLGVVEPLDGRG